MKRSAFIFFLSFLFIPSANAQSEEGGKSREGKPASYVSAGYHHLSRVYKSEYFDNTERFPVGVYGEYGYNIRRRSYILASVNFNRRSEPFDIVGTIISADNTIISADNIDLTYIQNIIDLKTGIKHHWDPKIIPRMSFYITARVGVEFYNVAWKTEDEDLEDILYIDDSGNTSHNLAANLGLGIYFKLHPSAWVDIAAGYRKVFDSRGNESLGGTYRYPYGRIGIVYPLGYR